MLPWWVLIPAFIAGAILGFIITAVCVYDSVTHPGRKWWEE